MVLCCICQRQVYPAEEFQYHGKVYHKPCFKCTQCGAKLTLTNARGFDKFPYCKQHSPDTNRTTTVPSAEGNNSMIQTQLVDICNSGPISNTIADRSPTSSVPHPSTQNPTKPPSPPPSVALQPKRAESSPTTTDRTSMLGAGYAAFQSQVELAGQIFTVDPVIRQSIFNTFNEFNIIVCGAPRVGKSTLINAICGRQLAKTDPGLDSCTKEISRYVLNERCCVDSEWMTYTYNFWDTPGFESWNETDIRTNFTNILQKPSSEPLCMIYCASPGSFADTEQLKWLLDVCIRERNIFCAFVVTNKWAGQKERRVGILNTYKQLLTKYHEQTSDEDGVTYFGNVALCTMVNTQPYVDEDQGLNHQPAGVDELIEGIMSCLEDDGRVFHWCMAVMHKRGLESHFAGKMKQRVTDIKEFLISRFAKKNIRK